MSRATWFKVLGILLAIAIAGSIFSHFALQSVTSQANHLAWCYATETGTTTLTYGAGCPNYYISPTIVDNAQNTVPEYGFVFWMFIILAVIIFGTLLVMTLNWLRGDYRNPIESFQQRRYDKRFAYVMQHGGFTEEESARLSEGAPTE